MLAQAAHLAHILRIGSVIGMSAVVHAALHSLDDRTGCQEEQSLEEGVRYQVEHAGNGGAHTDRSHHEAELADGGVGEHLLDVVLTDGNGGSKEGGGCARPR